MDTSETEFREAEADTATVDLSPTPGKVMQKLNITRSTYYEWMEYLGFKSQKQNGRAFLTNEQFDRLKELKMWRDQRGELIGFNEALKTNQADGDQLGELAVNGGGQLSDSGENIFTCEAESMEDEAIGDRDLLFDRAARIAAHRMTFPAELVNSLASQIEFDDLPEDLQQRVTAAQTAVNFLNPVRVARSLLDQHRSARNQPEPPNLISA
jgi:hypothetical protein